MALDFKMRQTSILAYQEIIETGKIGEQAERIYTFLRLRYPKAYTRNELTRLLKIPINAICGRVKELIDCGKVSEIGIRKDEFSHKSNAILRAKKSM